MPVVGLIWVVWSPAALDVLAGAAIELVSRAYFCYYAFRYAGARQIRLVVRSFRRGALGKFLLVAVLFGLLFGLNKGQFPVAVFAGYLVSWLLGTFFSMRLLR